LLGEITPTQQESEIIENIGADDAWNIAGILAELLLQTTLRK
jgi:hypothetical protein